MDEVFPSIYDDAHLATTRRGEMNKTRELHSDQNDPPRDKRQKVAKVIGTSQPGVKSLLYVWVSFVNSR